MKVPIDFPSEEEVILEAFNRHQALSPAERYRSIRGLLRSGFKMMRFAPQPELLAKYTTEQEELARKAFLDLAKRHRH